MMNREAHLEAAKAAYAFVTGNPAKPERERWIIDEWLRPQGRASADVRAAADPPDFLVDGVGVEVVEVMRPGRRRGDEYRARVTSLDAPLPPSLSLDKVRCSGHDWFLRAVKAKADKYDATKSAGWVLLVYFNVSWGEYADWNYVVTALGWERPPFCAVDVMFQLADGPVAHRLYSSRP